MTTPSPSNPFFSTILTLYTILYLYSPTLLLPLALSPVFILTGLLLLLLARSGATTAAATPSTTFQNEYKQRLQIARETKQSTPHNNPPSVAKQEEENQKPAQIQLSRGLDQPNRYYHQTDVVVSGWEVGAPLEVIHESYCEGHEEEDEQGTDKHNNNNNTDDSSSSDLSSRLPLRRKSVNNHSSVMSMCPSLSRYYPETDSDSDSGSVYSPIECMCFRWEEEEGEKNDGLIEIELDRSIINDTKMKVNHHIDDEDVFDDDEDSLIEIDIFSPGYGERW